MAQLRCQDAGRDAVQEAGDVERTLPAPRGAQHGAADGRGEGEIGGERAAAEAENLKKEANPMKDRPEIIGAVPSRRGSRPPSAVVVRYESDDGGSPRSRGHLRCTLGAGGPLLACRRLPPPAVAPGTAGSAACADNAVNAILGGLAGGLDDLAGLATMKEARTPCG